MKRFVNIALFLSILYFVFDNQYCQAQILTSNDGFEGTPDVGTPPPFWCNCDSYSTADTQPGYFDNYAPASQGQTYTSVVTRELNPPGTVETIWTNLLTPFEKDKCYSFKIDLSLSHTYKGSLGWDVYYFDNPCVLQVFGLNGDCSAPQDMELLWQSDVLDNYSWQTFDVSVQPTLTTFHKIAFRPFFSPPDNFKNSAVLIDNLRYEPRPNTLTCQDGVIALPDSARDINWYFNNQSISGEHSAQLPAMGSGLYTATFYDTTGCLIVGSENYIFREGCSCPCTENIVYFPSVFSPNGDLVNDLFRIQGENISQVDIRVYNRWGNLVFKTKDKNETWSGNQNGMECSEGVYTYCAHVTYNDGETVVEKGSITLIR